MNLDHLFLSTNAPGCSRYNEIECHFGDLTKQLGQIILVPEASKYFCNSDKTSRHDEATIKKHFTQAVDELKTYWENIQVNGQKITITNIYPPEQVTTSIVDQSYEKLIEFLKTSSKKKLKEPRFKEFVTHMKFLNAHLVRRNYFLHFRKCKKEPCAHCQTSPIINRPLYEALDSFDSLYLILYF